MLIDDARKFLVSFRPQTMLMDTSGIRTQGPNKRQQCGIRQKPSECQISE